MALQALNTGGGQPTLPFIHRRALPGQGCQAMARGVDAQVTPGVWGWQAAAGRQGLIQRPGGLDSSSSSSIAGYVWSSSSYTESAGSGLQGSRQSLLWTSASQLHGLDLQLQQQAAGQLPNSSSDAQQCSWQPAQRVASTGCSSGCGGCHTTCWAGCCL